MDRSGTGIAMRAGRVEVVDKAGEVGEVAIRAGWPSMCHGHVRPGRIVDSWYLTGELAIRDADGYFWFTTAG